MQRKRENRWEGDEETKGGSMADRSRIRSSLGRRANSCVWEADVTWVGRLDSNLCFSEGGVEGVSGKQERSVIGVNRGSEDAVEQLRFG